jgi:hypothetical protein
LEDRKKKKKRNSQGTFFPEPDMPFWWCHVELSWLLGAIKGWFKG